MNTQTKPYYSSEELYTKLTEHVIDLAEATDNARMSATMRCYLDMCAKFHRYSPRNLWLIMMVYPDATLIAGFSKWRSMDRMVRRGVKGIPIFAQPLPADTERPARTAMRRVRDLADDRKQRGAHSSRQQAPPPSHPR